MPKPKLKIKISPSLLCLHSILYMAGVLTIMLLEIQWLQKFLLIITYGLTWLNSLRLHVLLSKKDAILSISPSIHKQWLLQTKNGLLLVGELCGDSVITRYGSLLNFTILYKKRKRTVLVMPDAVDKVSYRQLCAYINTQGKQRLLKIKEV